MTASPRLAGLAQRNGPASLQRLRRRLEPLRGRLGCETILGLPGGRLGTAEKTVFGLLSNRPGAPGSASRCRRASQVVEIGLGVDLGAFQNSRSGTRHAAAEKEAFAFRKNDRGQAQRSRHRSV